MDIYQVIQTHNRPWSMREIICFTIIMVIAVCMLSYYVRKHKLAVSQAVAGILLLLFLAIVFASTVFTRQPMERAYELVPFWSWREVIFHKDSALLEENLLNCILLMPVGFLLPFLFRKKIGMRKAFLFGAIIAAGIESCQWIFGRGLFEWDDMIHNGLGCMIGCFGSNILFLHKKLPH